MKIIDLLLGIYEADDLVEESSTLSRSLKELTKDADLTLQRQKKINELMDKVINNKIEVK